MSRKARIWIGFAALCVWSGSSWLLTESGPRAFTGLLPVAFRSGALAVVFWTLNRCVSGRQQLLPDGAQLPILEWSALMAGLPTAVVVAASDQVSQLTETFVFALVPVFVVFFLSQSTGAFGLAESPLRSLAPALAGVAGAALLLPIHIPVSVSGRAWLLALPASAAISAFAAIRLHKGLAGRSVLSSATIFSASIFLSSAPFCIARTRQLGAWSASALGREGVRCLVFDAPVMLLLVWLLRELPPAAFSSRYLLATAVTIVQGYLLLRPETGWVTGLGLLLLIVSGGWLLLADFQARREL